MFPIATKKRLPGKNKDSPKKINIQKQEFHSPPTDTRMENHSDSTSFPLIDKEQKPDVNTKQIQMRKTSLFQTEEQQHPLDSGFPDVAQKNATSDYNLKPKEETFRTSQTTNRKRAAQSRKWQSESKSEHFSVEKDEAKFTQDIFVEDPVSEENVQIQPERTSEISPDKARQNQHRTKYQRKFMPNSKSDKNEAVKTDSKRSESSGKLQFSSDEKTPDRGKKKLQKAQSKLIKADDKLDKAQKKLPAKKKAHIDRIYDEQKGKSKRKLVFESEIKTQREHMKGSLPSRPIKGGANVVIGYGRKKIYEVEDENVGTKAAHRTENIGEAGVRSAYRFNKKRPYRHVARRERAVAKAKINMTYQKAIQDNPKLKTNMISRMIQKRKIKQQYAKAAKQAQKAAAKTAKKTGNVLNRAAHAVVHLVQSHPVVFGIVIGLLFIIFMLSSVFTSCSNLAGSSITSIIMSSYTAEDEDIDDAELLYTEMETDLRIKINNAEKDHPGYDEYRYNVGEIAHDPYELMAYLTAVHQSFEFANIRAELRQIFDEQYQLTFTEEIEVRYRTETRVDPNTGATSTVQVPYDWKILHVKLTSRNFSEVVANRMNAEQWDLYVVVYQTKGNRAYTQSPVDFNWLPHVTRPYGWGFDPVTGAKDYHRGVNIGIPIGTEVVATHDGTVTYAENNGDGWSITILGEDGLETRYTQCDSSLVSVGQTVEQGDPIAKSGSQLHYEVIKDGRHLNPYYFAETNDDGSGKIPPGRPGGVSFPAYPGAPLGTGSYADMIAEAEKHLGKAYVFGANGPANFDCSSFVCWVLDKSGVYPMGRTTAQGLYNICTPVSRENAMPGDLIFFHSTYSTTDTITHVGIYVGNGQMIHCGNPIQYTSINSNYWTSKFYAFGRVPA